MINKSFQLLRTNPALTTNTKLVVTSDYKLYLESFDTNKQLSDQKFKHFLLNKNNLLEDQIIKFYGGLSSQIAFDVKYDSDNNTAFSKYSQQFDDIYWSGAKAVEDNWYNEDYEYLAPLFIRKDNLPEGFIVLRVDEPTPYEEQDNDFSVSKLNKDNFYSQVVDKWKCVSFSDMRYQSDLGYFLYNNYKNNIRFPEKSFELNFKQYEYSKFYGIDYINGTYTSKSKFLQEILYYEQPHFKLEKEILNSFRSNDLIFPHILNLKFLFNDVPATPDNIKNYSLNRYYGFYIDKLEFVTNLTSYVTPDLKPGLTLKNNIFMSGSTKITESPFIEGFSTDKTYWIQYENQFYQVTKISNSNNYQVVSTFDMSGVTSGVTSIFNTVNDRSCFINYLNDTYDYNCNKIKNTSGYTNFISGYTSNFSIDPYDDNGAKSMFGDLYIIDIDGIYHILKKRGNEYFVQSDYAINSYPDKLEYWKGGKSSKYYKTKPIYSYGVKPIAYPVYRLKFSDIKDFDFNRVSTHFADFDYEKDTYHVTNEHKLYAVDYTDVSVLNKSFMTHPRAEDGQYQIMNVASEYVADDELYEISFNNLTDIWRKNQSVVKWGYTGSNSNCDYPYKLNNSIDVGDIFNSACDTKSNVPHETEKNLDYFYRIGNFFSGSTGNTVRYLNQTTNIETDFLIDKKFNLTTYLKSDVDYFDYFFKNKHLFSIDELTYTGSTLKYSTFQAGDKYSSSYTLFKGLHFSAVNVSNISRDASGKILNIITDYSKNYNNYKFAIILNDVYSGSSINENGLSGNTIINNTVNGIHVFLNEKFKNFLIVINVRIPIFDSYINLNNVPVFGEKYGLYNSKCLNGSDLITGVTYKYDPALITAANFNDAFDDMNTLSEFESGITYYYIDSNGLSGSTGPINIFNSGCTMKNTNWGKADPPFVLTVDDPELLETKKQSYEKGSIKGPSSNIYGEYETFYDADQKQKYNVVEPLARYINLNIQENNLNTVYASNKVATNNVIYRYNGSYEPIFTDIPIFNNIYIYSGNTKQWDSNYRFDTSFENFGMIEELVYSKVNPTISPLKLKDTDKDKSIYPMVDEYGYQYSSRFIFNSSWDKDFYVITNPDQNINKMAFANLNNIDYIIDPIQTKTS
jgi:hypothetical protein